MTDSSNSRRPPAAAVAAAAAATTTRRPTDTLAAAQARVQARQQHLIAQRAAQRAQNSTALAYESRISALPGGTLVHSAARLPFDAWDSIRGRHGTRPAFRVGQLDSELLDAELIELLKGQVRDGMKGFYGGLVGGGQHDYTPEITLVLRAILFKLSVWDHGASYGATLQGLRYTDARHRGPVHRGLSRWQKAAYGGVTVLGGYGWEKWGEWLVGQDGGFGEPSPTVRRLSRLTDLLSTTYSFAAVVSFIAFLINGRYRTILDRVLRMRLAPVGNQISREVSFEYLNRQLVWHAFTEFLLFLLPLVGIGRWRRWLARTWRRTKILVKRGLSSTSDGAADDEEEAAAAEGELAFLPERTCAICYQDQNPTNTSEQELLAVTGAAAGAGGGVIGSAQTDITNPYETVPCGHVYCFVCLATRIEQEEGEGWVCLRCGEVVRQCRPWGADVLEEPSRPSTSKSVRFENVENEEEGEEEDGSSVEGESDDGVETHRA